MTHRFPPRVALLLPFVALSSGCLPATTQKLQEFNPRQMLFAENQGMLTDTIGISCGLGETFGAALLVLLCIHCGIKAMRADVNLWDVAKDYVVGAVVTLTLLGSCRLGTNSPFWMLCDLGAELGKMYEPGEGLFMGSLTRTGTRGANLVIKFIEQASQGHLDAASTQAQEAVAHWLGSTNMMAAMTINTGAMVIIRLLARAAYAWLLAFYLILGPALIPLLALPKTRPIFFGWLKAFISINLWPCFFGITERIGLVLVENSPMANANAGVATDELLNNLIAGHATLLAYNLTFAMVYLGIPIAAYSLVNASSKPFRGII